MVDALSASDGAARTPPRNEPPAAGPGPEAAARLRERLAACAAAAPTLAVALSGGVDSRFLCLALQRQGIPFLALHAAGPHIPGEESRAARDWARDRALSLEVVEFSPLDLPEVASGGRERCYACKTALLAALRQRLTRLGRADALLCDGSNADDRHAYRPGLRALREAGVASPLAEAGIDKAAIRALGRDWGLENPDQAALPCLLTRFAYGCPPDAARLRPLAAAESALAALSGPDGLPALGNFRLRLRPAPLLQCERLPARLAGEMEAILRTHGFWPCDFEESARISGFYDTGPSA